MLGSQPLEESIVRPHAHRAKPDINIAKRHPEQTHPCKEHVAAIKSGDAFPCCLLYWFIRELVAASTHQMPQTMTAECIACEQDNIHHEHERADADAEMSMTISVEEKHRLDRVVSENYQEQQ